MEEERKKNISKIFFYSAIFFVIIIAIDALFIWLFFVLHKDWLFYIGISISPFLMSIWLGLKFERDIHLFLVSIIITFFLFFLSFTLLIGFHSGIVIHLYYNFDILPSGLDYILESFLLALFFSIGNLLLLFIPSMLVNAIKEKVEKS